MIRIGRRDLYFIFACLLGLALIWIFGIAQSFAERKEIREHFSKFVGEQTAQKNLQKIQARSGGTASDYLFKNDSDVSQEIGKLLAGKNIRLDREVLESGERRDLRILQSQYSGRTKDLFDFLTELGTSPRAFHLIEATLDRSGETGRLRVRLQTRLSTGAKS
ncbi:MAG: hypothetical protein JNM63_09515 [Spirochaetia bacterium]|nr:hypothetical protein [Spirochaetia bacterium]